MLGSLAEKKALSGRIFRRNKGFYRSVALIFFRRSTDRLNSPPVSTFLLLVLSIISIIFSLCRLAPHLTGSKKQRNESATLVDVRGPVLDTE